MREEKALLRARLRAARRARIGGHLDSAGFASGVRHCAESRGLGPHDAVVAAYLSMPTEPGTDLLVEEFAPVLVPRACVDAVGEPSLEWVEFRPGDNVSMSPLGIREPSAGAMGVGHSSLEGCALLVVPALALDAHGRRLGQGGGYYDRVLASLDEASRPLVVALVFDEEILDDVPAEAHDCRVDAAVTPTHVRWFTRQ